jgi:hypothetical protein
MPRNVEGRRLSSAPFDMLRFTADYGKVPPM